MSGFLESFMSGSGSASTPRDMSTNSIGPFANKIPLYRDTVVDGLLKNNIDLNQSIAKLASDNSWNDDQIQRVIEEANTKAFQVKYEQLKQYPDREVFFDVANLGGIKNIMSGKQATASSVTVKMEKVASFEESNEPLNAFNYSAYDTAGLCLDKETTLAEVMARKIAREHESREQALREKIACFNHAIYDFADALIEIDRHYGDTEEIYKHACLQGGLNISKQQAIKIAISEKIARLKDDNAIYDSYELQLNNVDTSEKPKSFSLGKNGFYKQAADGRIKNFPQVETSTGRQIRSMASLLKIATEINTTFEGIGEAKRELQSLLAKLTR